MQLCNGCYISFANRSCSCHLTSHHLFDQVRCREATWTAWMTARALEPRCRPWSTRCHPSPFPRPEERLLWDNGAHSLRKYSTAQLSFGNRLKCASIGTKYGLSSGKETQMHNFHVVQGYRNSGSGSSYLVRHAAHCLSPSAAISSGVCRIPLSPSRLGQEVSQASAGTFCALHLISVQGLAGQFRCSASELSLVQLPLLKSGRKKSLPLESQPPAE